MVSVGYDAILHVDYEQRSIGTVAKVRHGGLLIFGTVSLSSRCGQRGLETRSSTIASFWDAIH